MKSVISEKGQITIPKKIRTEMGLTQGVILEIAVVKGHIVATKMLQAPVVSNWRGKGKLPQGLSVDSYLGKIRE